MDSYKLPQPDPDLMIKIPGPDPDQQHRTGIQKEWFRSSILWIRSIKNNPATVLTYDYARVAVWHQETFNLYGILPRSDLSLTRQRELVVVFRLLSEG
jgi:hypothetical protein